MAYPSIRLSKQFKSFSFKHMPSFHALTLYVATMIYNFLSKAINDESFHLSNELAFLALSSNNHHTPLKKLEKYDWEENYPKLKNIFL